MKVNLEKKILENIAKCERVHIKSLGQENIYFIKNSLQSDKKEHILTVGRDCYDHVLL